MCTTFRGARSASAALAALMLLQACASTEDFRIGEGRMPDPKQLEADADACDDATTPIVVGVATGAAFGAISGGEAAAMGGSSGEVALVALVIGSLYGLLAGAVMAGTSHNDFERCMAGKGYYRLPSEHT